MVNVGVVPVAVSGMIDVPAVYGGVRRLMPQRFITSNGVPLVVPVARVFVVGSMCRSLGLDSLAVVLAASPGGNLLVFGVALVPGVSVPVCWSVAAGGIVAG